MENIKLMRKSNPFNDNEMQILIAELKAGTISKPVCSRGDIKQIMLADKYEILALDKATTKRLKSEVLQSLVAYGQGYMDEYRTGRYMFKSGPQGRKMADLDEAGIFNEMAEIVTMLNAELNCRV
ncbi:MAG: hypothetical protein IMZ64_12445 [Bacteroidetes bacterium]|nr:hypothetical protein [Bacteroidota bacterium]